MNIDPLILPWALVALLCVAILYLFLWPRLFRPEVVGAGVKINPAAPKNELAKKWATLNSRALAKPHVGRAVSPICSLMCQEGYDPFTIGFYEELNKRLALLRPGVDMVDLPAV